MKICIVTIATNEYIQFVERLLTDIENHFLPGNDFHCLLCTDHEMDEISDNVKVSHIGHKPWPEPAMKKYNPKEFAPGIQFQSEDELKKVAGDIGTTIFHPVGTCKMGQDEMSVVDEKLRVKGVNNLRVIDASIMPNITSGNTNAPTIMIAEKGADMILQQ